MLKNIIIIITGLISLLYLLNPTAGLFEIIPDALPVVGNLDEAAAVALLLACLRHFGVDVTNLFSREKKDKTVDLEPDEYSSEKKD